MQKFFSIPLSEELLKYGTIKEFEKGEIIIRENKFIREFPIVLEGILRIVYREEKGNELVIYYLTAGDSCIFTYMSVIQNHPVKIRAEAVEKVKILFIPNEHIPKFFGEYPEWTDYILTMYQRRMEELLEKVHSAKFKKVDEMLLDLLRKKTSLNKDRIIRCTHQQLARELGTSRVVVSRLLKEMEQRGIVCLGRSKIILNLN